jgi:2-polyprenyl-6-methoxyphenol hydroxylase-like FAD-dependent oxidoreductase
VTSLPVNRVANIILEAVYRQPTASVSFSHKVTETGQDAEKAWVSVQTSHGVQIFDADYIVGADGASSTIRHSLFNDNFPGYTWAPWLVATNVYYDFDTIGWHDINFIVHPEHWFMAARISKDGLWRVTYSEPGHLSPQEVIERQAEKFRTMLPNQPTPDQYKLVKISPYRIHQRCAERFRSGRFLLVADAAHLCNPMGGMGLTSGVVDVGGLYDCLAGIYRNLANESILDKYDEVRRGIYHNVIDKISTVNLQRLMMEEPDRALELDPFLKTCNEARTDPKELAKFAGIMRVSG